MGHVLVTYPQCTATLFAFLEEAFGFPIKTRPPQDLLHSGSGRVIPYSEHRMLKYSGRQALQGYDVCVWWVVLA